MNRCARYFIRALWIATSRSCWIESFRAFGNAVHIACAYMTKLVIYGYMHKARSQRFGFTIVELLVVIVVIGILAAIKIVSYTGISQRAVASSLQSDLTNAVKQLKMYSVDNGTYPQSLDANNCPATGGITDNRYCLKASPGNTLSYCPVAPYSTFVIRSANTGGLVFKVTDSTSPVQSSTVFGDSGTGSVTSDCFQRTHTFSPGTYNLTVAASGMITITINGAGGGGGGYFGGGAGGGYSSLAYNGVTYIAAGGGGSGFDGYDGVDGVVGGTGLGFGGGAGGAAGSAARGYVGGNGGPGGGAPYTMTLTSGGGGVGSAGYGGDLYNSPGGAGGAGGKVSGTLSVSTGQKLVVVVGSGGIGAYGNPVTINGANGLVTITYQY